MDFLMAQVDTDAIHLVERWRSNTIIRYIHTTEKSFTEVLSANMFEQGAYTLILPAHVGN